MSIITQNGSRLEVCFNNETMWIEPWGRDSLRVRATKLPEMPPEDWALLPKPGIQPEIQMRGGGGEITNGKLTARVSAAGQVSFYNRQGKCLLEEFVRNRADMHNPKCSALEIDAREFRPILGGDFSLTMRFESEPGEQIYGMGQYQQPILDLKNCQLELAHRNSQASVPFLLSSLGYGFLWNNPAIGQVTFGKNITQWKADSTKVLDYWITAGDSPAEIEEAYASVTGTVPMMPDYGMGFWQCKLRYQTQEELLAVARGYKERGLPISVIVVDFFHWPLEGEWKFDPQYWPDPEGMVRVLKEMGIELMVSVWPTVDYKCSNFKEMREHGYLINVERGFPSGLNCFANTLHVDVTHPGARQYLWDKIKANYYDKGVKIFWLDEAEPEYSVYDFDNYRYHLGPNVQIGNIYPVQYARVFYEGMRQAGQENVLNLLRCAWAGSQKYGALVWSGDIHSSYESLRCQLAAGLNMGIAGIPWWTTDIGGFHGGDPNDPAFRELFARWFEYGTFCPVMRLHGDRSPKQAPLSTFGGGRCPSGADNEVWSYGPDVYEICKKYMELRESMKPYIQKQMENAHEKGTPVMRPLFYDFPEDTAAWRVEDQYLFGPDYLVAPVLYPNATSRQVYLPAGPQWKNHWTGECYNGGQTLTVDAPLDQIPLYVKMTEK